MATAARRAREVREASLVLADRDVLRGVQRLLEALELGGADGPRGRVGAAVRVEQPEHRQLAETPAASRLPERVDGDPGEGAPCAGLPRPSGGRCAAGAGARVRPAAPARATARRWAVTTGGSAVARGSHSHAHHALPSITMGPRSVSATSQPTLGSSRSASAARRAVSRARSQSGTRHPWTTFPVAGWTGTGSSPKPDGASAGARRRARPRRPPRRGCAMRAGAERVNRLVAGADPPEAPHDPRRRALLRERHDPEGVEVVVTGQLPHGGVRPHSLLHDVRRPRVGGQSAGERHRVERPAAVVRQRAARAAQHAHADAAVPVRGLHHDVAPRPLRREDPAPVEHGRGGVLAPLEDRQQPWRRQPGALAEVRKASLVLADRDVLRGVQRLLETLELGRADGPRGRVGAAVRVEQPEHRHLAETPAASRLPERVDGDPGEGRAVVPGCRGQPPDDAQRAQGSGHAGDEAAHRRRRPARRWSSEAAQEGASGGGSSTVRRDTSPARIARPSHSGSSAPGRRRTPRTSSLISPSNRT